jgi:hypothetical protein
VTQYEIDSAREAVAPGYGRVTQADGGMIGRA